MYLLALLPLNSMSNFFFFSFSLFIGMKRASQEEHGRLRHIHRGCTPGKCPASFCSGWSPRVVSKKPGSLGPAVMKDTSLHEVAQSVAFPASSSPAQNIKSFETKCSPGRSLTAPRSRFLLLLPGQGVFTHQLHRRLDGTSLEPSFVLHRLFLLGHTCH